MNGRGQFSFLQVGEEQGQGPLTDRGWITGRNAVAQQILCTPELVVRLARERELHPVTLGRQGRNHRRTGGCRSSHRRWQDGFRRARMVFVDGLTLRD
jgi:hypothetical protein